MTPKIEPTQAAGRPLLDIRGVSRLFPIASHFGGLKQTIRAARDVSISVEAGTTMAVVGESGAGKTTIARLVLGLERPDKGEVLFDGVNVHQLRGRALRRHTRRIQAVFQNPWTSLDPRMRVGSVIAEPAIASKKMSKREAHERAKELLQHVGLPESAAAQLPSHFSGGQRQRIAIARALAPQPELIVLDEPVSALDVSVRSQVMNLLRQVQEEESVAYLMISHDLSTVRFLAHQVAVMYLGEVVESGPSESVFVKSSHPYTRALVSAALPLPVNHPDKIILLGDIPSPVDPPPGCSFHTRCWLYEKLGRPSACRMQAPALQVITTDGHRAACHFSKELLTERRGTARSDEALIDPESRAVAKVSHDNI